jgi:hypothetical protein
MKGSGKYPNFYQICSAVSITNFVLYTYAAPIVSVLLPIKKLQRHRMPCVGVCDYCHPINRAAISGGNAKKAFVW